MEERADVAPEIDLTIENWDAQFGEDGRVVTPIGDVKMGENQFIKLMRQGRDGKLGMIKPTLENPDVIIEDASQAKEDDVTERNSSYVFVKAFKKADGSRYYYFTSVTVSKEGKEVVISNQEKRKNAIANLLTNGKLVWKHADDVSAASDVEQGLYSSQGNASDPTTEGTDAPQTNDISAGKVSENSETAKEKSEKVEESAKENTETAQAEPQRTEQSDDEIKRTAAHFPYETEEEFAAFEKRVPDMSDEELLAYMREDGNGIEHKAHHPSVYDEYDYRHGNEIADAYDNTLLRLRESGATLEQAEAMLGNLRKDDAMLTTDERAEWLGQEEALQEYIDKLENELPGHKLQEHVDGLAALQDNGRSYDENAYDAYALGRRFGNGVSEGLSKKEAVALADKMVKDNLSRGGIYALPFFDGITDSIDLRLGEHKEEVKAREEEYLAKKRGEADAKAQKVPDNAGRGDAMFQKAGEDTMPVPEQESALRDAIVELLREAGIDVSTDWEEGQRVLDADRQRRARLMGSRVEKRKARIASELQGRELTDEQQAVVDVFTGKKDNQPLEITDKNGNVRRIVLRQGNEQGAGTKHSIFKHYNAPSNGYNSEEVLLIPDIIKNGERKQDGRKIAYEIERDGITFTITAEVYGSKEQFTNFYTNKKPNVAEQGSLNTDEQHAQPQQSVSGTKLQKVSEYDKAKTEKIFDTAKSIGSTCMKFCYNSVGRDVNITNIRTAFAREIANTLNERLVCPHFRSELETAIRELSLRHNREVYPEQPSNLLSEEFKTSSITGSKQGDVAKVLKEIVTAKENEENLLSDNQTDADERYREGEVAAEPTERIEPQQQVADTGELRS